MNESGIKTSGIIMLDDMKVLFPDTERYEKEDKEMLIAMLKDKDKLIERLWFELKATREREQLCKDYIVEKFKEILLFLSKAQMEGGKKDEFISKM